MYPNCIIMKYYKYLYIIHKQFYLYPLGIQPSLTQGFKRLHVIKKVKTIFYYLHSDMYKPLNSNIQDKRSP